MDFAKGDGRCGEGGCGRERLFVEFINQFIILMAAILENDLSYGELKQDVG